MSASSTRRPSGQCSTDARHGHMAAAEMVGDAGVLLGAGRRRPTQSDGWADARTTTAASPEAASSETRPGGRAGVGV